MTRPTMYEIPSIVGRRPASNRRMLAVWLVMLLGVTFGLRAMANESAESPEDRVSEVSDAVLALIEEARGYAKQDPERFYREVHELLDPVVDFDSFSRSVMAVHYREATPEQRKRFAESFKWGLVRTYALALTEFRDGKVNVLPPGRAENNPSRRSVRMEVVTPSGNVYPILYSMGKGRDGQWRVLNIIVNGVNMGLTYRNQFAGAMSDPKNQRDLDKVIDAWSEILEKEAEELEEAISAEASTEQDA